MTEGNMLYAVVAVCCIEFATIEFGLKSRYEAVAIERTTSSDDVRASLNELQITSGGRATGTRARLDVKICDTIWREGLVALLHNSQGIGRFARLSCIVLSCILFTLSLLILGAAKLVQVLAVYRVSTLGSQGSTIGIPLTKLLSEKQFYGPWILFEQAITLSIATRNCLTGSFDRRSQGSDGR